MNDFSETPDLKTKSPKEIASLCQGEIEAARDCDKREYRESRERALAYSLGDMDDTKSEPGRSQVQASDTADVVEWILPGLERLFFGTARIVDYQPDSPKDEAAAKQSSEYVNYLLERDGEGRAAIKAAMHDALVVRKGILKAWWSEKQEWVMEAYSGLSDDAFHALLSDGDAEVVAHSQYEGEPEPMMDPQSGQPILVPVALHDVRIQRLKRPGKVMVAAIPPENFLINEGATTLAKARFLCHRDRMSRTELVEAGYDYDQVMALPRYATGGYEDDDQLGLVRDQGLNTLGQQANDRSMDEIDVYECYVLADLNGDGLAEWSKVVLAGGFGEKNMLAVEEWADPLPFASLDPMPVPHRWVGRSVADSTMDIQQIKTVLLRQTLDNIYEQNHPQKVVLENAVVNQDAVINPQFNGVIRVKNVADARAAVNTFVPTFIADTTFGMLSYLDETLERRTGVSRSTMALDPEALQNQTAEAVRAGKDAQYSKVELIARNFAQGGLRDFFRIILKLVVAHQDRAETIRLRDEWVEMDPRSWNAEMDVTINTGLGTGSRERDLAMLMQLYGAQKELLMMAMQAGGPQMAFKLVSPKMLHNTLAKMVEASGLRDVDQYFGEIDDEEMAGIMEAQSQQSDPETQKAQAQIQIAAQKAQADATLAQQKAQADMEIQRERNAIDIQAQRERSVMELQHMREKSAAELQIKRDEAILNAQLRRDEMELEAMLTAQANKMKADAQKDTNINGVQ